MKIKLQNFILLSQLDAILRMAGWLARLYKVIMCSIKTENENMFSVFKFPGSTPKIDKEDLVKMLPCSNKHSCFHDAVKLRVTEKQRLSREIYRYPQIK